MKLSTAQVDEVLRSVLDMTLQLEPQDLLRAASLESATMVQAQIQFKGAWKGQVLLQVEPGLAREIAAVMMHSDPAGVSALEGQDAVGELANMIAGNLRPLVPGSKSMSLPSVTQQRLERLPVSSFPLELSYRLDGRALSIAVADAAALN